MLGRPVLDRNLVIRMSAGIAFAAALLLLAGVGSARADDFTKCQDKLQVAQSRLYRDVNRHGEYSRQARGDQAKLNDAQNWCSSHHVFSEQGRNFRDGRRDSNRGRGSYGRDQDAYRDPRDNGYNNRYYGPSGPYR